MHTFYGEINLLTKFSVLVAFSNTMKYYTIGQIFRLGLLKNHKGDAYTAKGTISKIVSRMKFKEVKTAFGPSKMVSDKEIKRHNLRWG